MEIQFKIENLICLNFEVILLEKLVNYTFNGFASISKPKRKFHKSNRERLLFWNIQGDSDPQLGRL
jgi:hypothetical protein